MLSQSLLHTRVLAYLTACGQGAVGGTFHTCCPTAHSHTRVLVESERKRWNLEHVVLDLFSHCTLSKTQWLSHVVLDLLSHIKTCKIQRLSVSCRGSGFRDLFHLFASFAQLTIRLLTSCEPHSCCCSLVSSQRPHLAARPPPCAEPTRLWTKQFLHSLQLSLKLAATCTRHRPSEADIARERNLLQLRVIHLCDRYRISQDRIWNLNETAVRMVPSGERGWTKKGRISPCLGFARLRHGHTCSKHERRHVDTDCL